MIEQLLSIAMVNAVGTYHLPQVKRSEGPFQLAVKNTHTLFPSRRSTVLIGKQSKLHMARNYSLFPLRFSDHQYTFAIGGNENAAITENTIAQNNNITDENN